MTGLQWCIEHEVCEEPIEWIKREHPNATLAKLWEVCPKADWMIWALGECGVFLDHWDRLRLWLARIVEQLLKTSGLEDPRSWAVVLMLRADDMALDADAVDASADAAWASADEADAAWESALAADAAATWAARTAYQTAALAADAAWAVETAWGLACDVACDAAVAADAAAVVDQCNADLLRRYLVINPFSWGLR